MLLPLERARLTVFLAFMLIWANYVVIMFPVQHVNLNKWLCFTGQTIPLIQLQRNEKQSTEAQNISSSIRPHAVMRDLIR